SHVQPYSDAGILSIYAATAQRQGTASAQLIEEVLAEAAQTATTREVDRVRTQSRAGLLMSVESPWGQAHYVARQLAVYGRLVEPSEVIGQLQAVTVEDVRAAGAKILSGPRARATIGFPAVRAA
ncbi:MAG TPA: insulinase family protein, partial [Allosphingosinicella sp.]